MNLRPAALAVAIACAAALLTSSPALADSPRTVTFTATCDGQTISGTTIRNSSPVLVLAGQQAIIKEQTALNTTTGVTSTFTVPGFEKNSLPTTTCTFTVPYLTAYVFTVKVHFTPARH